METLNKENVLRQLLAFIFKSIKIQINKCVLQKRKLFAIAFKSQSAAQVVKRTNEDPSCFELITNPAAKINDEHLSCGTVSRKCLINDSRKVSFLFELRELYDVINKK